MANPTTNYSWPMPTSADLVTDLPADFALFGQPVDTSLKALNPETTLGDISFRSATSNTNTRLGIGTAGQVLAVSGGVPAWTTTSDVTPLTTKGDLFTFTTVDARLGVGSNAQVLTADSTASSGLAWATAASGGMTLLSTTTLSGAETVISSINQTYTNLFITVQNVTLDASGRIYFIPNATSNLTYVTTNNSASTTAASLAYQGNVGYLSFAPTTLNTGGLNSWSIIINNYANATSYKSFSFNGIYRDSGNTFDSGIMAGGATEANDAITAITFTHNQTSFNAGTVKIYGVK